MASKFGRTKALPWLMIGQAAMVARDHWQKMDPADRARATELLKQSKLRPAGLTPAQRKELTEIVRRADLKKLGRDLAPLAARNAVRGKGVFRR